MATTKDRAEIERLLAQQPFLRGLAPEHLALLADGASYAQFDPGHYLCREGDRADFFYLVHRGRVALELNQDESQVAVQSLEAGDVLGWSWLVPPYRWRFNGRAIEATQAIALDGRGLRTRCEAHGLSPAGTPSVLRNRLRKSSAAVQPPQSAAVPESQQATPSPAEDAKVLVGAW